MQNKFLRTSAFNLALCLAIECSTLFQGQSASAVTIDWTPVLDLVEGHRSMVTTLEDFFPNRSIEITKDLRPTPYDVDGLGKDPRKTNILWTELLKENPDARLRVIVYPEEMDESFLAYWDIPLSTIPVHADQAGWSSRMVLDNLRFIVAPRPSRKINKWLDLADVDLNPYMP